MAVEAFNIAAAHGWWCKGHACCLHLRMDACIPIMYAGGGADRIARMEAEAIDIAAEERRASERIRQIDSQKTKQLQELANRLKVLFVYC